MNNNAMSTTDTIYRSPKIRVITAVPMQVICQSDRLFSNYPNDDGWGTQSLDGFDD